MAILETTLPVVQGPSANEGGVSTKMYDRFKTGNALHISKKVAKTHTFDDKSEFDVECDGTLQ